MKVFVTGVGGQLGHDVMNELAKEIMKGQALTSHPHTAVSQTVRRLPGCLMCRWILRIREQ